MENIYNVATMQGFKLHTIKHKENVIVIMTKLNVRTVNIKTPN